MCYNNIQSEATWHRQYLASSLLKPQLLKLYIQSVNSKIMSHFHSSSGSALKPV